MADSVVNSGHPTPSLTSDNVRSMVIDGSALWSSATVRLVAGHAIRLDEGPVYLGPRDGKTSAVYGPFNQVFRRPFCFQYPADNAGYRKAAGFLTSYWSLYGNGRACGVTDASALGNAQESYQWVHMGESARHLQPEPFDWDGVGISFSNPV